MSASSISATLRPTQARGPWEKGMKADFCLRYHTNVSPNLLPISYNGTHLSETFSHLSGLNSSASGPQISVLWCIVYAGTLSTVP